MSTSETGPSRLSFLIALFAAPALFGIAVWAFGLMGDYASRFSLAGAFGLVTVLPAWFTAFAWLAWRDTKIGQTDMWPRVKAALSANFVSLVIFPALILLMSASGDYEALMKSGTLDASTEEPLTPRGAAIAAALMAFALGLVFLPVLAWIFERVSRVVGR